jgi:hypothetical protein
MTTEKRITMLFSLKQLSCAAGRGNRHDTCQH